MRYQGRIASWNEARGFGFITPEQNGAEQAINGARSAGLFVHVTALQSDGRVPEPGERVTYLIGSGQDGKPRALQVFFPDRPLTLADAVPWPNHQDRPHHQRRHRFGRQVSRHDPPRPEREVTPIDVARAAGVAN